MAQSSGNPNRADEPDDRSLIERAQAGDQRAFRLLYERHASSVYRFAVMPLVRDKTLAEDLVADTFVRAMENIDRFRWQGRGVLPWLVRIGKNLALDHLRKSGRQAAWPDGFEQQLPDSPDRTDAEQLLGKAQLSDLLAQRIEACMGDLNPRYREVIRLRLIEKISRQEAASRMDVTVGTLDVLLFRACRAFRRQYGRRYAEQSEDLEYPK